MSRTRAIKPEFWADEKLARLSRDSRLTFIGLWTTADDYGVTKGNHRWLRAQIFPYDDGISIATMDGWMRELTSIGAIIPFEANGESYYYIRTFGTHQKVDHPSRVRNPEPPDDILARQSRDSREPSRDRRDETETETETETEETPSVSPRAREDHPPVTGSGSEVPTLNLVLAYADAIGLPEHEARKCYDHYDAYGWVDAGGKRAVRSWHAIVRLWLSRVPEFAAKRNGKGSPTLERDASRYAVMEGSGNG